MVLNNRNYGRIKDYFDLGRHSLRYPGEGDWGEGDWGEGDWGEGTGAGGGARVPWDAPLKPL